MREVILIKNGEIVLKGLNRPHFEDLLMRNIKRRLGRVGKFTLTKAQSAIMVEPAGDLSGENGASDFDFDRAIEALTRIFGIASFSRACVVEKEMGIIKSAALDYLKDTLSQVGTFKVESKRSDKKFPLKSPEISEQLGGFLLEHVPGLRVDVHSPDVVVHVEIRDHGAYIHAGRIDGAGGMPVGSNGKAMLLISGGIDSPVAGYMLAKRGVELCAVHFASPPYTSERAKKKVLELLHIVSAYSGRVRCFVVPFTKIQEQIRQNCPEELFTIVMRRLMMKIANRVAAQEGCPVLATGESIGQVASQTIDALCCTEAASDIPVFRPLIGMDKEEIIAIARRIGTFETSILPYEDCCTVFTPKHPRTKPKLAYVEAAEGKYDFRPLMDEALNNLEKIIID